MRKLFKILGITLVGAALLSSCSKDQESAIYTPGEGEGIYSFDASSMPDVEFTPSITTAQIEVIRAKSDGEATLAIASTQTSGGNAVNVLNVPSEVTFADGESFAFVTVSIISANIQENTQYSLTLSFADEECSAGGVSSTSMSFSYALWESIGTGQYWDNISGMMVTPEVLKYVGAERYRIMNPFTAEVQAKIAENVGGAVGGPVSSYIDFTVDADYMLSWSGCWNVGVLADGSMSWSSLNYYYGPDSPFSGGEALASQCGMVQEGIYQFVPHLSAFSLEDKTSGWVWSGVASYFALPGYDLEAFLNE